MPRPPRIRSCTGIEHIMLRGVNKQNIFLENSDRRKFLRCVMNALEKSGAILHVYCLMNNHVHLLIQKGNEPLGETVKRFAVSYVFYFRGDTEAFQLKMKAGTSESSATFCRIRSKPGYVHTPQITNGAIIARSGPTMVSRTAPW